MGTFTALTTNLTERSVCSFRTTSYLFNAPVALNREPFLTHVRKMQCLADHNVAHFNDVFTVFRNAVVDPARVARRRRGGELMERVWNQREQDEYIAPLEGYFTVSCDSPPPLKFRPKDHLQAWGRSLACHDQDARPLPTTLVVPEFTLAIQRYEYVNLYHTMCDYYNAFVLMLLFGVRPDRFNILFVDTHPAGALDGVWDVLFGRVMRAGHLDSPAVFHALSWGMLGYFSPLNEHERDAVPYLDDFRGFMLARHNVSAGHTVDCARLRVTFIWRHNYVAHPRNQQGSVVRKFANEDEMLRAAREALGPQAVVEGHQMDQMPMKQQLEIVAQCDIFVGMHGAGLSHILFLPNTSAALELKPNYSNPALVHFKAMAKWRGIPYSIWHNSDRANEESDHRTRIPADVLKSELLGLKDRICRNKGVS